MTRKMSQGICFFGSACGLLIMSVALALFYPGSYLTLNRGNVGLQITASLLFWGGLLVGIVMQCVSLILRRKQNPEFKKNMKTEAAEKTVVQRIFKNKLAMAMAVCFLVGVIGTVCSLIHTTDSRWYTFVFMALALLGLSEYLAFNSVNFAYAMHKE